MLIFSPVETSHNLTVSSAAPEASFVPSGENAIDSTLSLCPVSVFMFFPVKISHSLTVLSIDPEASFLPSGENATDLVNSVCPVSVLIFFPVETSHSLTALSTDPEASFVPSGENATAPNPASPSNAVVLVCVDTFHSFISRPSTTASFAPSGENAIGFPQMDCVSINASSRPVFAS